ncbi:MAG: nucleotidyltransferase family protein, partial [Oscillospiraceae bacterium]
MNCTEKPKIAGVITEFNPFHKGHKYFLKKIKQMGYTHIVCAMSPNFVQRGDIALLSKWQRTKMALNSGADLIIEIPTPFALSCGEKFAQCGVHLLSSLGCVDTLFFGSESGDVSKIEKIAFSEESIEFKQILSEHIKCGKSYPTAYSIAFDSSFEKGLLTPNNILGAEYIKAIKKSKSQMDYKTIKRLGVNHDSNNIENNIASASFIRKIALKGDIIQAQQLCDENFGFLDFHFAKTDVILAILRTKTKDYFNSLADCENGLGDKIYDSVKKANTFEEVVELSKSKCYTRAKICRIIFSAVLQIDKTYTK